MNTNQQPATQETNNVPHATESAAADSLSSLIIANSRLRRQVQILESVPDLVVVFDSSGCISFVSRSVTDFLGSADELEGTSFWNLVTEESQGLIQTAVADAINEEAGSEESYALLNNGSPLLIDLFTNGQESQIASIKGTVFVHQGEPECVCSIRVGPHQAHLQNFNRFDAVSLISDNEDAKTASSEKTSANGNGDDQDAAVASSKRARESQSGGESSGQDLSGKRIKSNTDSLNQVSDNDIGK